MSAPRVSAPRGMLSWWTGCLPGEPKGALELHPPPLHPCTPLCSLTELKGSLEDKDSISGQEVNPRPSGLQVWDPKGKSWGRVV